MLGDFEFLRFSPYAGRLLSFYSFLTVPGDFGFFQYSSVLGNIFPDAGDFEFEEEILSVPVFPARRPLVAGDAGLETGYPGKICHHDGRRTNKHTP